MEQRSMFLAFVVAICLFGAMEMIPIVSYKKDEENTLEGVQLKSASYEHLLIDLSRNFTTAIEKLDSLSEKIGKLEAQIESSAGVSSMNTNLAADRLCTQNPYVSSLNQSLSKIAENVEDWMSKKDDLETYLVTISQNQYSHLRFDAFQEMATCNVSCVGGGCRSDRSKIVCGLDALKEEKNCIVYSIGSNNYWEFENSILQTTSCEVFTFDCTGPKSRFNPPQNDRLHFYHICLGAKPAPIPEEPFPPGASIQGEMMTLHGIQKMLNHERIDLLKMDIEGFEWPIMKSWPQLTDPLSSNFILPYQVLVEIHYKEQVTVPKTVIITRWYETDMFFLAQHFHKLGYATIVRDNNSRCKHCTELTLVRFRCPDY